ncbi:MAG: hypothetical protein M1819_002168 [Sarea resinae]|nr:MAG: hypothetical protein M1819_002168 [Sarea resinae]
MAGSLSPFKVGQTVELQDGRIAKVRFIGSTLFATGDWVGVELDDLSGKNDGAVQGERYFDCELGRGMFVRPAVAKVIEQPAPKVTKAPAIKGRPQSGVVPGLKRQSTQDATARRQTINAGSPTPMGKPPVPRGLRSPTKSPTKQMNVKAATPAGRPTTVPPRPRPSITRTPMAPPPAPSAGARTARQPVAGRPNGSAVRSAVNRLSLRPEPIKRVSSLSGTSQGSDTSGQEEKSRSPSSGTPDGPQRKSGSPLTWGVASRTVSSTLSQKSASTTATREVEDLKTKLRMMEKKRMEDREKLKALERIQGERDKFEMIIQKLQAKYHPQQQEITDLRKELKESQARLEDMETEQADHEIALEMATLDREMAEETAEVYKTELDALKQKSEELELEVEVLREENQELGQEMSTEERTSQGWLQMERTNERLREALLRLRDMTQQQEGELRDQIKSLEEDVQELGGVKEQYEVTKEKLQQSDAGIEDLRQQLDTALGAEEMIEELTDKNLALNEEMEELRATIEDLESLKELNDELEINHVETEKQMQEEIDYKNSLINDHSRRAAQQEEAMEDYEYTIARFRELVTNLQSDLEDMRASQQITETEAEELTNRSRAMMDLNMKLQLSASKTQVKTIDLELRRLEAQEASEHLAIVQLFLPEAFHTERDSVLALLRFKRVGFKSNLLHGFVKERVSGQALPGHEDDVFSGCDVLDKLTWVSAMCNRFVNYISTCSVDDFARFEGALYDLEPVERAMNGWIDGLRRDEMKEKQCAVELQR